MTFAWQTHPGDRSGVRFPFVPPLAEFVPMEVEVVLPIADSVDLAYGDVVLSGRLPLFYWKTDITAEQPLQRGINNIMLPQFCTKLEFGVYRNVQEQVTDNEYVYAEEVSGQSILKVVIFKTKVEDTNINLPRYGQRNFEIDITRFNKRKPSVLVSFDQSASVFNAEVAKKQLVFRFNEPTTYQMFFMLTDAMSKPFDANSPTRLASVAYPAEHLKYGVLNNPNNQVSSPYVLAPAWLNGTFEVSSTAGSDTWNVATFIPYPIEGEHLGKNAFIVPIGTRAMRFTFSYNRTDLNQALISASKAQAWERVFINLSKYWLAGEESGRNYKDTRVEPLEILYSIV